MTEKVKSQELQKLEGSENLEFYNTGKVPFREAIGILLYLFSAIRPEIANAVYARVRLQLNLTEQDWKEVTKISKYLKATARIKRQSKAIWKFESKLVVENLCLTNTG